MDVKDILGVRGGAAADKVDKPKAAKIERPKGMSREAFKLLDDSHPINPSQLLVGKEPKGKEKKRPAKNRVQWSWNHYKNSGRVDKFQMQRWQRIVKDPTGKVVTNLNEDYWFAKYNKKVSILKYSDEEYRNCIMDLKDSNWSKEETDYLLGLCEQFDLRFTVIHDRYHFPKGPNRSIEDIKARYYAVSRRLLSAREGAPELVGHEVIMKQPYDWASETERKRAIDLLFRMAPDAAGEQERILAAAKRIEARRAQEAAASSKAQEAAGERGKQSEGPAVLEVPSAGPTFFDHELRQVRPQPGAYSRAAFTREELRKQRELFVGAANKPSANASKMLKAVEQQMDSTGIACNGPRMPTVRTCLGALALQKELLELIELRRKAAERKQAPAAQAQPQGYIPLPTPAGSQLDLQAMQVPGAAAAIAAASAPDSSRGARRPGTKGVEGGAGDGGPGGAKGGGKGEASTPRAAGGRKK